MIEEETTIMECKLSKIVLVKDFILMLILIGFITIWGTLIKLFTTKLSFSNKKVHGKVGLLHTKELDTPLNKVNNISVSQGIWGKIFNYGTINISSSSGSYSFNYISDPNSFKTALLNQIDIFDEDRVKKQAEAMAKAMK